MSGVIEICNLALAHLGQGPILSIENPTNNIEELCQLQYPIARDSVVGLRMWTFATAKTISTSVQLDEWGQRFSHDVPSDWLNVMRVYRTLSLGSNSIGVGAKPRGAQSNWNLEGGKILSDDSTVYLWGIKRITDATIFPPLVVRAIASQMAADMCMTITENSALKTGLLVLAERDLSEATSRDGGQGRSEVLGSNQLTGARYK